VANSDRPNGFRPVGTIGGASYTGLIRAIYSPAADRSSDTTNSHGDIYIGDPISISTAGAVTPADAGESCDGVAVGFGVASSQQFGADGSIYGTAPPFDPANLTTRYLGYASAGWVYYVPTTDVIFEVQSASDLDLEVGSLADITNTAATAHGSQTTGYSSCELTTASNNDVRVVDIVLSPQNDPTLANARYRVMFETRAFV